MVKLSVAVLFGLASHKALSLGSEIQWEKYFTKVLSKDNWFLYTSLRMKIKVIPSHRPALPTAWVSLAGGLGEMPMLNDKFRDAAKSSRTFPSFHAAVTAILAGVLTPGRRDDLPGPGKSGLHPRHHRGQHRRRRAELKGPRDQRSDGCGLFLNDKGRRLLLCRVAHTGCVYR